MNNNKIMNFDEFCKYLNIGRNNGYKLLSSGQVKACKVGRKWVIQKKDVNKFLKENGNKISS